MLSVGYVAAWQTGVLGLFDQLCQARGMEPEMCFDELLWPEALKRSDVIYPWHPTCRQIFLRQLDVSEDVELASRIRETFKDRTPILDALRDLLTES